MRHSGYHWVRLGVRRCEDCGQAEPMRGSCWQPGKSTFWRCEDCWREREGRAPINTFLEREASR